MDKARPKRYPKQSAVTVSKPPVPMDLRRHEHPILNLQRAIGNQAVLGLLRMQAKNAQSSEKLAINAPGDPYEREADQVAEKVMTTPSPKLEGGCHCGGTCSKCRAKAAATEPIRLQAKPASMGSFAEGTAPEIVHEVLRSPGQPLDASTRAFMEPRFGHDFGGIRVHHDAAATESAKTIQALAYTAGDQLVFDQAAYRPDTQEGKRLLAHELAHTLQQKGRQPSSGMAIQRQGSAEAPREKSPAPPRRRMKSLTARIEERVIDIVTEDGNKERRHLTFITPDAVPGVYRVQHHPIPSWTPQMPWNTYPGAENAQLFTWDGPQLDHGDPEIFKVVATVYGQEVHSVTQAMLALPSDMQFLLSPKGALQPRTREEEEIAYQIVKTLQERKITPTEVLQYQREHPGGQRARNYREQAEAFNEFFKETAIRREARENLQTVMAASEQELEGGEAKYEKIRNALNKVPLGTLPGRPAELASLLESKGDISDAAYLRAVNEWTKLFEEEVVALGNDLLLNLELQLKRDENELPAYSSQPWKQLQQGLKSVESHAEEFYASASEHSRKAAMETIGEAASISPAGRTGFRERAQQQRQAAKLETQIGNLIVRSVLPKLRAASLFQDFPFERVVHARNHEDLRYTVRVFLVSHLGAVRSAREKLNKKPETIYKLDNLLAYAKKKHSPEITTGSFYDHVIQDRGKAVAADESLLSDLLMLLSIALSLIPGVGPIVAGLRVVAGAADLAQLGLAAGEHSSQEIDYQAGLRSTEPSATGVVLSTVPLASRAHALLKTRSGVAASGTSCGRGSSHAAVCRHS
jgi:hypothetical protein